MKSVEKLRDKWIQKILATIRVKNIATPYIFQKQCPFWESDSHLGGLGIPHIL
jgi:hypothetical protein